MVERVKSTRRGGKKRETLKRLEDKKPRAKPNRTTFTDLGISRLKPPKKGQRLYWDKAQKGLALLVSSGGTKTFRSQYKLHGKWQMRSLGVFGEVVVDETENANVAWAHTNARKDRALAKKGIDPKQQEAKEKETQQDAEVLTYVDVVDQFIEKYAKPRQRTWDQTERTLKGTKAEQKNREGVVAWHNRPFAEITKKEAYDLLDGLVADGRGPKAELTLAWLRTLWRWAWKRDLAPAPIMDAVEIEVEKRVRKKVFDDEAIRATWNAAERLHNDDPVASAFVKLLVLLAPRKAALAGMRRSHLNDPENPTLWTTPPELVKQNKRAEQRDEPRKYLTPLPPLAARIIKGLLGRIDDGAGDDLLFPSSAKSGVPISPTGPLTTKVVAAGGPADFQYHAWRHTVTSWLQNEGCDKFDRGLVLNHAESGVTAGYSHGYGLDRKRDLLEKWAGHVEGLVDPDGAAARQRERDNVVPIRGGAATG